MLNTRTFKLQVKKYCKIETMLTQSVVIYKTPAFLTYFYIYYIWKNLVVSKHIFYNIDFCRWLYLLDAKIKNNPQMGLKTTV